MAADQKTNAVRDLLLGEDAAAQADFILGLVSDAAEGKELLNVVSDVIQVRWVAGTPQRGAHCVQDR